MTPADQDSYRRQFEQAKRRLPRGHLINHCTWRDGQLTVLHARVEKAAKTEPEFVARVRRGAAQESLF